MSRPSTAAASSTSRPRSLRRSRRRATSVRTPAGAIVASVCARSRSSLCFSGSSSSSRSNSRRKYGLPPVNSCNEPVASMIAGIVSGRAADRTSDRTSWSPNPGSGSVVVLARGARRSISSARSPMTSSSRSVATMSRRSSRGCRSRYRRSASVGRSAQWRSSMTSTIGAGAKRSSVVATASNSCRCAPGALASESSPASGPDARSGSSRRNTAGSAARAGSSRPCTNAPRISRDGLVVAGRIRIAVPDQRNPTRAPQPQAVLIHQGGLADAGRTDDQGRPALARSGLVVELAQTPELRAPPDEADARPTARHRCRRCPRRGEVEVRTLQQHVLLEPAEPGRRRQSELLVEPARQLCVDAAERRPGDRCDTGRA